LALLLVWYAAAAGREAGTPLIAAVAGTFRFFTMQTNLFVMIWLLVAIVYWHQEREHPLLRPVYKGAFTLYISVTFLVFAVLLAPLSNPQGVHIYTNAITHYVTPVAFIVDWFLFERKRACPWRYALFWLLYPLMYFIFALIYGGRTGDYIYPFLNLPALGLNGLATWFAILFALFLVLGLFYIGVNRVVGVEEAL
ncbi:MAG: Pr6Pr family membrane protein, partial [Candidatus Promineifilaceae bacterium]|nr:Pr6Pr family membrane protein [Candidatus Promineifilaceae bacterium]